MLRGFGRDSIPGGFRVLSHSTRGTDCCDSQFKDGTITSKKLDLSGYATLRFKAHLTLYIQRDIRYKACRMIVRLYSNIPNTPDLEIASGTMEGRYFWRRTSISRLRTRSATRRRPSPSAPEWKAGVGM